LDRHADAVVEEAWRCRTLLVEVATALYLSLMSWLLSAWFVGKSAFHWTPVHWYFVGATRFLAAATVAAAFALLASVAQRRLTGWYVLPEWISRRTPWGLAAVIACSGLVGSIHFVLRKPFM
jgi:hypothetical protein